MRDREQWQREHRRCSALVADAGIAPTLEWVDEGERRDASRRRSAGSSPRRSPIRQCDRAPSRSVVETLAACTACRPTASRRPIRSPLARALWREQIASARLPGLGGARRRALIERADALLATDPRLVPSHNDMNPTNVLWDGERVWLVDWERRGSTHPYYDLAASRCSFASTTRRRSCSSRGRRARTSRRSRPRPSSRCAGSARSSTGRCSSRLAGAIWTATVPQHDRRDRRPSPQFYARLGTGELASAARGQAMFGAAMLKEAIAAEPRRSTS